MIALGLILASSIISFDTTKCDPLELSKRFECVKKTYDTSDNKLNQIYQELLKFYDSDYEGIGEPRAKLLKQAQRDWIKFRDSSCNFENPQGMGSGGEGYGVQYLTCQLKKTTERINYMSSYIPKN